MTHISCDSQCHLTYVGDISVWAAIKMSLVISLKLLTEQICFCNLQMSVCVCLYSDASDKT